MKRALVLATAVSLAAAGGAYALAAPGGGSWSGLRAGVAVVDATWHVGAGAGQYASDANPTDVSSEWDPNVQHLKQASSYGVASRLTIRAIVMQDGNGDAPIALVKDDNYLAQDMLTRRVGQLLAAAGNPVSYDHILLSATHDHNSPYYSTPAAGVWLFQDVMDLRMFEYQARQMGTAIEQAYSTMVPARVGATTVQFGGFQGNIAGSGVNEDGSPTGYPLQDNDHGLVVMRIDDMTDPSAPTPLATWVNYAEHGESLDGYDLISADWLAPFQRFVDRATGAPVVFSQGSVGSAEGPYEHAYPPGQAPVVQDGGDGFYGIYGHMGYAQAERGTHLLAEKVMQAWQAIGGADNGVPVQVPFTSEAPVLMLTRFFAGPLSHPYPSVGNCRTGPSLDGDPGVPAAGLPDCGRTSDVGLTLPFSPQLYAQLKSAGAPVPDNYDVSSFGTVEENLRLKLQAVRIGDILLASCSCEPQADLIRNLETRTDDVVGDMDNGFDYKSPADVEEAWPVGYDNGLPAEPVRACYAADPTSWSCPDPRDPVGQRRLTVSNAAFDHMEAEINNDAAGWNDPSYAAQAGSEPTDLSQIKGNFTHTELGAPPATAGQPDYTSCRGYALSVGLGHTGDYNGYTVSYREYQSRDAYRKALTSYGPHTADYMNTNLLAMAANLRCGIAVPAQPTDPIAAADEARQTAEATAIGQISSGYYDGWAAQIPDSAGPAGAVTQPHTVSRFDDAAFSWVGGDNWTDNPNVVVQRYVDGEWRDYADQSGEVQVVLNQPQDVISAFPDYRSGGQQWMWTASFEAFDAYPRVDVPGGQVPDGRYQFVVDGFIHQGGVVTPYHLVSKPFDVTSWTGVTVSDLQRGRRQVSFVVDPIVYPRLPLHPSITRWYADDNGGRPGQSVICKTCAFRPWATTGRAVSAYVEVIGANGSATDVPASYDASTGRWVARVSAGAGSTVLVPAGAVRDGYGETNGAAYTFGAISR